MRLVGFEKLADRLTEKVAKFIGLLGDELLIARSHHRLREVYGCADATIPAEISAARREHAEAGYLSDQLVSAEYGHLFAYGKPARLLVCQLDYRPLGRPSPGRTRDLPP